MPSQAVGDLLLLGVGPGLHEGFEVSPSPGLEFLDECFVTLLDGLLGVVIPGDESQRGDERESEHGRIPRGLYGYQAPRRTCKLNTARLSQGCRSRGL